MEDRVVLEGGRAIRPYLDELALEAGDAASLDRGLAEALAAADERDAATAILELLTGHPAAAEWLLDFEELGVPPALDAGHPVRGASGLSGDGGIVRAMRFRCPVNNDYVWHRRTVGQPVRSCPTHQVRLVPDARPA